MRTENEILSAINALKSDYLSKVDLFTSAELYAHNQQMKQLQAELSSLLSFGANPCPRCSSLPHGMIFRTQIVSGVKVNLYEVGCLNCKNTSARGSSAKEAVEKWNNGEYREDFFNITDNKEIV